MSSRQSSGFFVAFFTSIIVSIGTSLVMYFVVFPRLGLPPTYTPGSTMNAGMVSVPMLKGYTLTQARAMLKQLGLKMEVVAQRHHPNPAGTILAHSPPAGSSTPRGTVVQVSISLGPLQTNLVPAPQPTPSVDKVKVPKLTYMNILKAKRKIRAAGLKVGRIVYDYDEDVSPNWILRQSPPQGRRVPRGTKVNLVVNRE